MYKKKNNNDKSTIISKITIYDDTGSVCFPSYSIYVYIILIVFNNLENIIYNSLKIVTIETYSFEFFDLFNSYYKKIITNRYENDEYSNLLVLNLARNTIIAYACSSKLILI